MSDDPVYTSDEAIEYVGLDRQGLRQPHESLRWLCRTGKLKYAKIGRRLKFRKSWLDDLVERNAIRRPETRHAD
ncbi:helix-turn-helix domain-containing protein [Paludisphaera soli]|uniref:helix-turn-helix domain-containing protein n=1 Tax=Paludisphaera soli TaxID=2712865 RepID=UPI0013EE0D1A|nr:helix-turn-helix domain-containing protein [Paludisphaera soli]